MELSRVSTCTYPMRERDVESALRVVADAGFKKVDLWGRMPHFSPDKSECDRAALLETAGRYGIRIANLGTYPGAGFAADSDAEREKALEEMKETIDAAAELGARSIRFSPGEGEDRAIIEKILPLCRESAKYAEEKGIYLGMENHRGSIACFPDACVELCEKVGSEFLGVLYEPCNLMHAGVDYKRAFETFRDFITHTHIKDGRHRDGKFERTMLGEGEIDIPWVVEKLTAAGYEGDFALEYEICDIVPIEEGLGRWLEYFLKI